MTCAVTPTRSDLVSMTTDAPLKAAAQEFVCLCMCASVHTCIPYISVNKCIPFSVHLHAAHASLLCTKIDDWRSFLCVCVYMSVFPHNKACSLIFNAAETTTSTQSEPGKACFPAQTNLPCQQETKLRDTVWNGSKHGSRHPRTLNPPNDIQGILSNINISVGLGLNVHAPLLHIYMLKVRCVGFMGI